MTIPAEAFLLLTLPNTTLSAQGTSQSGVLSLECVTVQVPDASQAVQRDVYLVLRLGSLEIPIDPARIIQRTDGSGWRTYTFFPTESDPSELVVSVSPPTPSESNLPHFSEDLETFETILAQYGDLRGTPDSLKAAYPVRESDVIGSSFPGGHGDLRGHLVVINQDNGEVVGQFDDAKFRVQEDPKLHERGHENDAVIIEVPDAQPGEDQDANALQMFIRAVPPDQQDWITKSATIVSHAISTTTNLLLTTITTASNYYISHSTPSPHNPRSNPTSGSSTPTPQPRALVFLTSERTRKGLAGVHAVSGQAVKVSTKTVTTIDSMIRRAMGGKPKKSRQFLPNSPSPMLSPTHSLGGTPPHLSSRTPSPSGLRSYFSPPPAYPGPPPSGSSLDKPSLPPRRSTSPAPPPLPPRTASGAPENMIYAPQPQGPLSTKARVLLSADLILSTIDHETRRLLDTGTQSIGAVVGHKYGPDAAESSLLMAGTARNVALVYVDMRGIGRRALLKRAGKQFVKARVSSNHGPEPQPQPQPYTKR
ncbi:hypothetical protein D9615_001970 [Tricholomella constricta]|uniref:Senescence domain-containing protein n=1 Tax=Tricholomella constricta TaxID=117010 RepID=A0A8H5MAP2_9AGAR|nr:hypothetical protein D9615_001970 [Tricholomella constricta]